MSRKTINRWYTAIIYEEDPNATHYIEQINKLYEKVTYILHDKDLTEDGELKKPHYHFLFYIGENARHVESIAKEIGIPSNYLEGCNKKNMLLYLIHFRDKDKTQYKIEAVKGELKDELQKLINKENQDVEQELLKIIQLIKEKEINTITDLMIYSIENNMWQEVKRSQMILCKLIEENKIYK